MPNQLSSMTPDATAVKNIPTFHTDSDAEPETPETSAGAKGLVAMTSASNIPNPGSRQDTTSEVATVNPNDRVPPERIKTRPGPLMTASRRLFKKRGRRTAIYH